MPHETPIRRVLIANRGEIAARIARTCRKLGIFTVAVFSDADKDAIHVHECDESVHIGGSQPGESYLVIDKLVQAALKTSADAVHPGYGFLSENPEFAAACEKAGLIFIGPPPSAINAMGDKANAKTLLTEKSQHVPLIPGYGGSDQSVERLAAEAQKMGFPVLVKAAAGGGGRGMRVVRSTEGLAEAITSAKREAESAFGSSFLLIEKYLDASKHVEIQIFGDKHGNVSHLFERDCSVQRRHQKVIEESPCPVMHPALRGRMAAAAEEIGRLIGYVGAGTVEFLVDCSQSGPPQNFYFLEVNTRLQVEHPVTEAVTGLDLVACQLHVAQGASLEECGVAGAAAAGPRGHALEVRLCAEDPDADFAPSCGKVLSWRPGCPQQVRYDAGVTSGSTISVFYDPMIAKVIAHGATRADAIRGLCAALQDTALLGVRCNQRFLLQALQHPDFVEGGFTTGFIAQHAEHWVSSAAAASAAARSALLMVAVAWDWRAAKQQQQQVRALPSGWRNCRGWRRQHRTYRWDGDDAAQHSVVEYSMVGNPWEPSQTLDVHIGGAAAGSIEVVGVQDEWRSEAGDHGGTLVAVMNGVRRAFHVACDASSKMLWIQSPHGAFCIQQIPRLGESKEDAVDLNDYTAPMPARVLRLLVEQGSVVTKDQPLLSIESMKMESVIKARTGGVVQFLVKEGDVVDAGGLLLAVKGTDEK